MKEPIPWEQSPKQNLFSTVSQSSCLFWTTVGKCS